MTAKDQLQDDETMGRRIQRLAEAKALSQSEIARILGVTRASVGQWWHDSSPNIKPHNLIALAELLGTDIPYLVHGPTRSPPTGKPRGSSSPSDTSASGNFRSPFKRSRNT